MSLSASSPKAWWQEPMVWLVAGLPATAVVAGITTVVIAFENQDSLVKANIHKEGLIFVAKGTDHAGANPPWAASANARLDASGNITVELAGQSQTLPQVMDLDIVNDDESGHDITLRLVRSGQAYQAHLPDTGMGKRQLVLQPEDRAWRLSGEWQAPDPGEVKLVAEAPHSSTHP